MPLYACIDVPSSADASLGFVRSCGSVWNKPPRLSTFLGGCGATNRLCLTTAPRGDIHAFILCSWTAFSTVSRPPSEASRSAPSRRRNRRGSQGCAGTFWMGTAVVQPTAARLRTGMLCRDFDRGFFHLGHRCKYRLVLASHWISAGAAVGGSTPQDL